MNMNAQSSVIVVYKMRALCTHWRKVQMDLKLEIERLEKISSRQTFYMQTCDDVSHEDYRRVEAENDVIEQQLKDAWTAYKEHKSAEKARAAAAAAATAAALEREAGVQAAMLRLELMSRHKANGRAYLLTAREAEDPMQKLSAANLAVFSFEQYKKTSLTLSLREEVSEAQSLAAAAQKELDKPFYVKWFELLVTG